MYAEYARTSDEAQPRDPAAARTAPRRWARRDRADARDPVLAPGSPVLYYGDEIGMGDNVYLGDRDGVRTPMQWTGDRDGGFSRADFAQLYLPPLMDPVFGFQAVNVEAQLRSPTSLVRWLQRFVALRKEHPVFGLGSVRDAPDDEPARLRPPEAARRDTVLCVHNLARSAQAVELDLSRFEGRTPIEMIGGRRSRRSGSCPTSSPSGRAASTGSSCRRRRPMRDPRTLSSDELLGLVSEARWFAAKGRVAESAEVVGLPVEDGPVVLAIVEIRFTTGTHEHYLLAFGEGDELVDALERPEVAGPRSPASRRGRARPLVRRRAVEQLGRARRAPRAEALPRLEAGPNPELELLRALAQALAERAPAGGALETPGPPLETALASVTALVPAWGRLGAHARLLEDDPSWLPERAWRLGEVTAELHAALASDGDPHFAPRSRAPRRSACSARRSRRRSPRRSPPCPRRRARSGRPPSGGPPRPRPGAVRLRPVGPRDPDARRLPPRPGALDADGTGS